LTTRVVVLMHEREVRRPSNTGRLALACLTNSALAVRHPGDDDAVVWRPKESTPALLFPSADAVPLAEWHLRTQGPVTLLVPDGTWGQARRLHQRLPGLRGVVCVKLPAGPPTAYHLRAQVGAERVSTMEAIARALGVLEGPEVQAALERVFTIMVDRTLWMRGRLARDCVTGGIPEEAAAMQRHASA
jgi:DTW domain-containing protein